MIEKKIQEKITNICGYYNSKIDSLLSICESPIETLFLANFINFYAENSLDSYNISFLYRNCFDEYIVEDGKAKLRLQNYKHEQSGIPEFRFNVGPFYIYGMRISYNYIDWIFDLIPQYEITEKEISYRLDFAVIGKGLSFKTNKEIDFKIFIECDGFDYHKTKSQISYDNDRANYLKSLGWLEFRYLGKDIYSDNFSAAKDFNKYIFTQIIHIHEPSDLYPK